MKRFSIGQLKEIENPAVDAFLLEVLEVSKKHGLSINTEDGNTGFIIEKYHSPNLKWLMESDDHTEKWKKECPPAIQRAADQFLSELPVKPNTARSIGLKLYIISALRSPTKGEITSAVVCVPDEQAARHTNPDNGFPMKADDWERGHGIGWVVSPNFVNSTYIGDAASGMHLGVVMTSRAA